MFGIEMNNDDKSRAYFVRKRIEEGLQCRHTSGRSADGRNGNTEILRGICHLDHQFQVGILPT